MKQFNLNNQPKMSQLSSIDSALRSQLTIYRLAGFAIAPLTSLDWFILSIHFIIGGFVDYFNIKFDLSVAHTNSFIIDKGNRLMLVASAMGISVLRLIALIRRKRTWNIIEMLRVFDRKVRGVFLRRFLDMSGYDKNPTFKACTFIFILNMPRIE
jgi:hypothetical protein